MTDTIPPLSEFINLSKRRDSERKSQGFSSLTNQVTVACYPSKGTSYQILCIRIAEDMATKHRLTEGLRMTVHVHPDGGHIALTPGGTARQGSRLFRPKGSKSLLYQTTLKDGMLPVHGALPASIGDQDGAVVITLPIAA